MATSGGLQSADGVDVANSATGANAILTVTLPGVVGRTTEVGGFEITADGSTAGLVVTATLTGVVGGPLNYVFTFPVGALVPASPLIVEFSPALPASATNTPIVLSLPAGGAGNSAAAANIHGFQL